MNEESSERKRGFDPIEDEISSERLAELRAMLARDPEIQRMNELFQMQEERGLTPEEDAELEAILRPDGDKDPFLIDDSI